MFNSTCKPMTLVAAFLLAGTLGWAGSAAAADGPAVAGGGDAKFMMKAAQGGMMEVKLGRLAQENAADPDVKAFGARMVADHTKAGQELQTMAHGKGLDLSGDKVMLPAEDQAMCDQLEKLHGADFDRMYIKHMVEDHHKDISEFEDEAKNGSDKDVKSFAAKTLPTLKQHLKMAEAAQAKTSK